MRTQKIDMAHCFAASVDMTVGKEDRERDRKSYEVYLVRIIVQSILISLTRH
jgi:hypothetical protein